MPEPAKAKPIDWKTYTGDISIYTNKEEMQDILQKGFRPSNLMHKAHMENLGFSLDEYPPYPKSSPK